MGNRDFQPDLMKLGRCPKASAVSMEGEGGSLRKFWHTELVEQDFQGAEGIYS